MLSYNQQCSASSLEGDNHWIAWLKWISVNNETCYRSWKKDKKIFHDEVSIEEAVILGLSNLLQLINTCMWALIRTDYKYKSLKTMTSQCVNKRRKCTRQDVVLKPWGLCLGWTTAMRLLCQMSNGELGYFGPGSLSVVLRAWCPFVSTAHLQCGSAWRKHQSTSFVPPPYWKQLKQTK